MSRFIFKFILYTTLFGVLMATAIFGPPVYLAEPAEPEPVLVGPGAAPACHIRIYPNGMMETGYDANGNGRAEFITLSRSNSGEEDMSVALGLSKGALFYAIDENENGEWEILWRDLAEDGINGNETIYWKLEEK